MSNDEFHGSGDDNINESSLSSNIVDDTNADPTLYNYKNLQICHSEFTVYIGKPNTGNIGNNVS